MAVISDVIKDGWLTSVGSLCWPWKVLTMGHMNLKDGFLSLTSSCHSLLTSLRKSDSCNVTLWLISHQEMLWLSTYVVVKDLTHS